MCVSQKRKLIGSVRPSFLPSLPAYLAVDSNVHKVSRQQVQESQERCLDLLPMNQPQLQHSRHGRPVRPDERHHSRNGSNSWKRNQEGEMKGKMDSSSVFVRKQETV